VSAFGRSSSRQHQMRRIINVMEATKVNYRIISGEAEWPRIAEFFHRVGIRQDIVPSWRFARAAVAEYEGQIIACLFMQVAIHFEPLVVDGFNVELVYVKSLLEKAEEALATSVFKGLPYFAFVDSKRVERLAEICGMEKLPDVSVMCKEAKAAYVFGKDTREEVTLQDGLNI
jgi:hypothetical protein